MRNIRIIARLDVKYPNLIKGIHLEGVKVIGDPNEYALKYYQNGIDEILYQDAVATLYGRNNLEDLVRHAAAGIFVPMTVGGGIRTVEDVDLMLRAGADKISINTAAIKNPKVISEISKRYGKQCIVVSIEAKRKNVGYWEAYTDNGREKTGMDVLEWIQTASDLGAGEILITSIDQEGTCLGFDLDLIEAAAVKTNVPIIASGGMGKYEHALEAIERGADAISIAYGLHHDTIKIDFLKKTLLEKGYEVRI